MKRSIHLALIGFSILLSGCSSSLSPTGIWKNEPKKPQIDPSLPTVEKIRTLSDIQEIALEWTPIYDNQIEGYFIYRAEEGKPLMKVAQIGNRYRSHYLNRKLKPNTTYIYKMTTYNSRGYESVLSEPVKAKTLPVLESVSYLQVIDHLPKQVKLLWRPHPNESVEWYIIERTEPGLDGWEKVGELRGRLNAEFIDTELEKDHTYHYRIRVKTCKGVVSKPSKVVTASTKEYLIGAEDKDRTVSKKANITNTTSTSTIPSTSPSKKLSSEDLKFNVNLKPIEGLKATKNLPKKITLNWTPVEGAKQYNIYRSYFKMGPYLEIASTSRPTYTDLVAEDGVRYYYKVTAITSLGYETPQQEEPVEGKTLSKPRPPIIISKGVEDGKVYLEWESLDNRGVNYTVVKRVLGDGDFFGGGEYKFNVRGKKFVDSDVKEGEKYSYTVYAVDKYSIVSEPSGNVVITVEKR
ncbi:MAG: fibronectin type III domain-containing protein [Epsilonproteobacteria bacterium]|nr:fibronectin type III domain-containing protein [Campylobacterota bacterium]